MRFPDLLATKKGRLAVFFFLYVTEGIPFGFTATAISTQMRRQGLGPSEVGSFVASLYLPWAFKWIFGPFVDVFSSERLGRRRMWIVGMQVLMIATLLAALPIPFTQRLWLFTIVILVHNVFAATQDVAIDALACNVLREEERGLANGLMFAGSFLGQSIGGSGVLFLTAVMSFQATFLFVAGWVAAVTIFIALPLREPRSEKAAPAEPARMSAAVREIGQFALDSGKAFIGSRAALIGVLFALLPAGAAALGLALQSNLAVELGLSDAQIGWLNLWSALISAGACVLGGHLSDRFGRRRMLALYIAAMSLPTFYLAMVLQRAGWILPIDPQAANRPIAAHALVVALWTATLAYSLFNGLSYGTRTALFMDVTTPAVAATQFTAYMAMLNFTTSYSVKWQGMAIERFGYPATLVLDGVLGVVSLVPLAFMAHTRRAGEPTPGQAIPEAVPS